MSGAAGDVAEDDVKRDFLMRGGGAVVVVVVVDVVLDDVNSVEVVDVVDLLSSRGLFREEAVLSLVFLSLEENLERFFLLVVFGWDVLEGF